MPSCLIIAGEKSGEEHALTFFPELKSLSSEVEFFGVGGDDLKNQGVDLLYHLKDFSSMGFSEVIGKIPFYAKALKHIEGEVIRRKTKVAILIDFQGFNMRLAARLSKLGVKVLYYVAPQAWAWKAHRAELLANNVHTLFTILPFEKKWFQNRGVKQVRSIPHPLMLTYKNELSDIPEKPFGSWEKKLKILLLPGSRNFEIQSLLPTFIQAIKKLRETYPVEVHLVKVNHVGPDIYEYFKNEIDVLYDSSDLVPALKTCHFSFAASGTVTLSTGLFELPTVVCYQASLLNEFVYYNFIKYSGPISLTNLIQGELVFPELVQGSVNAAQLSSAIRSWLEDEKAYNKLKTKLKNTKFLLSGEDFSVPQFMAQVIHE